jgi:hypothetical protein
VRRDQQAPFLTVLERTRVAAFPAGKHVGQAIAELITAHQLWSEWLGSGRVRKFAVIAEKQ